MFVNAPLKLGKTIGLVLYSFAYGANANIIVNRFNVGAFTMHKYVDIVINVLVSKDGFFLHVAYPMFMELLMHHIFHFHES
jgi:hypothetical protein